jgi:LPXTG-motif cell wall-anchored protein
VPGEGDSADFWVILGGMLAVLASMIAYFRKRGWL